MDEQSRQFRRQLMAVFAGVAILMVITGALLLAHRQAEARAHAHRELGAIADLKMRQITTWRNERLADARFFMRARFVANDLRRYLEEPASESARATVWHWLNLLKGEDRYYEAVIYDAKLQPLLALPEKATEPQDFLRRLFDEALRNRDAVMTDLHQDETNGAVHLNVLFPVFDQADPTRPPLGAVLLTQDARQFLFPVVASWPAPSRTAEAYLVRREGNQIVVLSDLRHAPGGALQRRLPFDPPLSATAQAIHYPAVAREALDYRGVPVVAVGRGIPETPWIMVAKVDQAEVYAELRLQTLAVAAFTGASLLAGSLLVSLMWRRRSAQFLERQLKLEKERAALADRVVHLMRNANDIILLFTTEGRVLEANECALRNYGYTLPEIQSKSVRDLRAPESAVALERQLREIQAEGGIFFEALHQRKDGSKFPVEVSSRKIAAAGETIILSIVRDITQRKAHEREIERMSRLYAALSQVNQAVVRAHSREELARAACRVLVEDGGFDDARIAWTERPGFPLTPLARFGAGKKDEPGHRETGSNSPDHSRLILAAFHEGRPSVDNDLAAALDQDGSAAGWRSLAAFPIREQDVVRGVLTVHSRQKDFFGPKEQTLLEEAALDISFGFDMLLNAQKRRDAEDMLRSLNLELEQRVKERTSDLEAKNRSLQAFAYSVSHDLKAPLRGIAGFAEMLADGAMTRLSPDERQMLEKISRAAARMKQLIEDLLAYSRLEIQAVSWSQVDLAGLVEGLLAEFQPEIERLQTRVESSIRCAPLTTDASGLTQALRNLIGNAIKFSAQSNPPVVSISARDEGDLCVVEVRDNGIGFDMRFRDKIFELFQRLHSNDTYPGTGVGLAIVHRAITRIGGRVRAESEPGQGAAFFLELPRPPRAQV